MKLAIISTTIHGEKGYLPFDRLAAESKFSDVVFVIAGDMKSAPFDSSPFRCRVEYLDPAVQARFRSSEEIGWNKIMRRNIALLRAIELDPDYILTIDDDNVPDDDYFNSWHKTLTMSAKRIVVPMEGANGPHWHNYLASSDAPIELYPRGFPIVFRGTVTTAVRPSAEPIPAERIGLYQGISLGHPDIDALTRAVHPHPINRVEEKNYCLRDVWSPYNTQNTIFAKPLFPLAFVWPYCGRYDDIYSSFVWQRFLFNNGMYAHVGEAFNRQSERRRSILGDMAHEVEGYLNAHTVWSAVNRIEERDAARFIERLAKADGRPAEPASLMAYPIVAAAFQIPQFTAGGSAHPIIARHQEFFLSCLEDLGRVL